MFKRTWKKKFGKSEIYTFADSYCQKVEMDMLRLAEGDAKSYREEGKEYALVILGGKCTVNGEGFEFKNAGTRKNESRKNRYYRIRTHGQKAPERTRCLRLLGC